MTEPITVVADAAIAAHVHPLVASLPRSFAFGGADAQVAVVDGADPRGWDRAAGAALDAGAETVAVLDPAPIPADRAAAVDGGRVLLSETFAGHPAVARLVERAGAQLSAAGSASLLGVGTAAVREQLLEQLRLLRAIGYREVRVRDVQLASSSGLISATARYGDAEQLLRLQIARSSVAPARLELRAIGATAVVALELPCSTTARPARAEVVDADGALRLPDVYETAHRAAWRALAAGGERSDALPGLVDDLRLLDTLIP